MGIAVILYMRKTPLTLGGLMVFFLFTISNTCYIMEKQTYVRIDKGDY